MNFNLYQKITFGVLIALITSLGLMATDIYAPAMPEVSKALSTSPNIVQLTVTLFLIASGLSQLIYGPLSDHFGRKPILIIGLGIYIIGSLLCTFANNITALLLARFIQGMGAGAIMALNRILIRDAFSGPLLIKALSFIGAFVALAPALAPALGGFIEMHGGWRWVFGFLLIFSVIITLLSWFLLPETHLHRQGSDLSPKKIMANYFLVIQHRAFWANVLCAGLSFAAMISCATINPFILENSLGKTPAQYGVLAMISTIGFFMGMIFNSKIVEKIGVKLTLKTGNWIILLSASIFIIMGLFRLLSVSGIILPTIAVEFGIALVFPNAFIGAINPFPHMAGTAGALYGCLQVAISFFASIIVALVDETTQLPLGILLASFSILSLLAYTKLNPKSAPD